MVQEKQTLQRSRNSRILFGVAGGMAEYLEIDPVLVRMGWVLLVVATAGMAALAYIVLAVITPNSAKRAYGEARTVNDSSSEVTDSTVEDGIVREPPKRHLLRNVFGVGLVVVGVILLLQNLDLFDSIRWDIVWPVAIVALGVTVLVPSIRR